LILDGASITDNTAATGPSIFRLDTGTTLTTMGEDNDFEDVTGT
jgi:hypothetical protein